MTDTRLSLRSRLTMWRNLDDLLGKNILRDVFQLRGSAETEAEVPPGHAKRFDLWFVPELDKLALGLPTFTDLLEQMTAEPGAFELWSGPPSVDDFHGALAKRENLREVLELRDKRPWPRPMLWHVCAGKPEKVFDAFGYALGDFPGSYRPHRPGLRVQVVVLNELAQTRSTLLLRLLGRGRVRREALREVRVLPEDAWEKQLAHPWLVRVGFEMPLDRLVASEDRELVMDIQAWYKNFIETHDREVKAQAWSEFEPQIAEGRREGRREALIDHLTHQFQRRVGRSLSADERETLTACVKKYGAEHLADLVLDLSGPELAAWLETNGVARND